MKINPEMKGNISCILFDRGYHGGVPTVHEQNVHCNFLHQWSP